MKLTQIPRADPDGEEMTAVLRQLQHLSDKIPSLTHSKLSQLMVQKIAVKLSMTSTYTEYATPEQS